MGAAQATRPGTLALGANRTLASQEVQTKAVRFLDTHLPPSQPIPAAGSQPPGLARTLPTARSPFWSPALDSTLRTAMLSASLHCSAFTSPPEPLSLARRHGLQGSLCNPVDLHRFLLATAPRWLHFKAGAAQLLQVSAAAGTLAEGLWQEGVLSQLPSTGKQHMWMSSSPRDSFWRPQGWGQVRVQGEGAHCLWDGVHVPKAKTDL